MVGNEGVRGCTAHLCNFTCIGGGDDYRQQGNTFFEQGLGDAAGSAGDMISPVDGQDCLVLRVSGRMASLPKSS